MKLYIEIENGQPKNHPAFEENLLEAFGVIPTHWEEFVRVEKPEVGVYQILENEYAVYEKVNSIWSDVWFLRDMTVEEKLAKQNATKQSWATRDQAENWVGWVFNEEKCMFFPPLPRPRGTGQNLIFWCGAENNWKDAPLEPIDENQYKFNYASWQWVQVVN